VQAASSLLALYYAMLIFAMAPYFLARSSMWGQLQSFLLPFSLCTAACLVYRVCSQNSEDFDVIKLRSAYPLLVVALSASLSFASITLHPDSLSEYQRIFARPYFHALENGVPITSSPLWSQFRLDKLDPQLFPSVNHLPQEPITVRSEFPNMRQVENPQISLKFTLPATRFDFLELPAIRKKLCDRIQSLLTLESTSVVPSEKRDFLLRSCNNR
jgi:hypothetical protein